MNRNGVVILKVFILPDQLKNILRAEHPARLAGQQEEDTEFNRGELNRTIIHFDRVGLLINLQGAKLNQIVSSCQRRLCTVEGSS
ncbi:hypothetical protein D3C86_1847510 [compost metagenome]